MGTKTLHRETKFTYADYLLLPENGKRVQLIEGEFYMSPAPKTYHQDILRNLVFVFNLYLRKHAVGKIYLAPTDVVFSEENVVQPDLLFIAQERLSIVTEENIQGAPDFVGEVLSEKTGKVDSELKRKLYAKYGVQEYWLVDPKKKEIEVLRLEGGVYKSLGRKGEQESIASPLFPKLRLAVKEIFQRD